MWLEPKFHGDMVRIQYLKKDDKFGLICIQQYKSALLVSSYLPGYVHEFPDRTSLIAEQSRWCGSSKDRADLLFDSYVVLAFNEFWYVDYKAERNGQSHSTDRTC